MKAPTRILHLEDDPADAELVSARLECSGVVCAIRHTLTGEEFEAALRNHEHDLVLADFRLPGYDGLSALRLVRAERPDTPFIFVSGTMGEDAAIEALTQGATDYVLKQNLTRLGPAVLRALSDAENRRRRSEAELALTESEARYRHLFNSGNDAVLVHWLQEDGQGRFVDVNEVACVRYGYARDEFLQMSPAQIEATGTTESPGYRSGMMARKQVTFETTHVAKDGKAFPVEINSSVIDFGSRQAVFMIARDITRRKEIEEGLRRRRDQLEALRTIDEAITANLDLDIMLRVFLDQLHRQLDVDAADVLLLDPQTLILRFAGGIGFRTVEAERTKLQPGAGLAGKVVRLRRMLRATDVAKECPDCWFPLLATEGFVGYYGVPLISKGQVLGVLEVFHRRSVSHDTEWVGFLEALANQVAISIDNATLLERLQQSNYDLTVAYDETIAGWSRAMDLRDHETEGHARRVTQLALSLAQEFGLDDQQLVRVRRGALLHDIGKMGIPDSILLKPGKLTAEEREIMKKHTTYAEEMLGSIEYLKPCLDIPCSHHERWDGTGYPKGLKGTQIPLIARLFAAADVWDALTSDRPYRPAWSAADALEHIRHQSGGHFDPEVVERFLKIAAKTGLADLGRETPRPTDAA